MGKFRRIYYYLIFWGKAWSSVCYSSKFPKKEEQLSPCPSIYCYLAVFKSISYITGYTARPHMTLCFRCGKQNENTDYPSPSKLQTGFYEISSSSSYLSCIYAACCPCTRQWYTGLPKLLYSHPLCIKTMMFK